jgi:hypothetical protein
MQLTSVFSCAVNPRQVSNDEIYVVVNAGCRDKDLAHIGKHLDAYKVRKVADYAGLSLVHSHISKPLNCQPVLHPLMCCTGQGEAGGDGSA